MPDFLVDNDEFGTLAASILSGYQGLRFKARGRSMRPFIHDGDIVEVKNTSLDCLIRGDVVLCRLSDGRLVVHRVIMSESEQLLIQGDALPYTDGFIPRTSVLGKVISFTRNGKHYSVQRAWMMSLVSLWLLLTPVRNVIYRVGSRLHRCLRKNKLVNTIY